MVDAGMNALWAARATSDSGELKTASRASPLSAPEPGSSPGPVHAASRRWCVERSDGRDRCKDLVVRWQVGRRCGRLDADG